MRTRFLTLLTFWTIAACKPTSPADDGSDVLIYGGKPTAEGDWLTSVAVVTGQGATFCTGTLVHPKLVISAAHCFDDLKSTTGSNYSIVIGSKAASGRKVKVDRITNNPGYRNTVATDFAYLTLQTPVTDVPLIPIATDASEIAELLRPGAASTIVGFGRTNRGTLGIKHEVTTKVNSNPASGLYIGGNGKDSCQGDSGGPAYGKLADGSWRVYGITSRGGACGTGGYYARMHDALCFIQKDSGITIPDSKLDCPGVTPIVTNGPSSTVPAYVGVGAEAVGSANSHPLAISALDSATKVMLCVGTKASCIASKKEDIAFSTTAQTLGGKRVFHSLAPYALEAGKRLTALSFDASGKLLQASEIELFKLF